MCNNLSQMHSSGNSHSQRHTNHNLDIHTKVLHILSTCFIPSPLPHPRILSPSLPIYGILTLHIECSSWLWQPYSSLALSVWLSSAISSRRLPQRHRHQILIKRR